MKIVQRRNRCIIAAFLMMGVIPSAFAERVQWHGNGHASPVNIQITPDARYHLADLIVNGQSVGVSNSYSFDRARSNVTITAVCALDQRALPVIDSITPSSGHTTTHESVEMRIRAHGAEGIAQVTVNGNLARPGDLSSSLPYAVPKPSNQLASAQDVVFSSDSGAPCVAVAQMGAGHATSGRNGIGGVTHNNTWLYTASLSPGTNFFTVMATDRAGNVATGSAQYARYAASPSDLSAGLVAYYPLNGNANDESGNNIHGQVYGGAMFANGHKGGVIRLDGDDDYVDINRFVIPTTQSFTVALWARQSSSQSGWREIIAQGQSGDSGFYIGHDPAHHVRVGDAHQDTGIPFPSDGQWHQYAVIVDRSSNTTRFYIDCELRASWDALPISQSGSFTVFGRQFPSCCAEFFQGDLDEAYIYSRAISSNEVRQLYEQDSTSSGETVLYFSKRDTSNDEYDLYTMRPDPANPNLQSVPMNDSSGDQCYPVVSPDGRFVLYSGRITASPLFQLWVLDRLTGERRFLFDGHPEDWHPSGQRFVYISNEFCSEAIHEAFVSVTATGLVVTSARVIFDSDRPAGALGVQYSPDGNRIAFDYGINGCWYANHEIYVGSLTETLPLQESDLIRLTSDSFCDARPHWTPDGQQIVWGRSSGQNLELWRKNADGLGSEQRLGTWTNAESAYVALCAPPAGYAGPYTAAFYHNALKDIILLRNDGGQDTLDIGPNDFVDGLEWVSASNTNLPSDTIQPTAIHYVSLSGAHVAPFTTWDTAATNIQAAIDVSEAGDTVLVTNGVYDTGGRVAAGNMLTNRVAIDKSITVRSANGPTGTVIQGSEGVRCAYMTNGAVLAGFTLSGGQAQYMSNVSSGGGVLCESTFAVLSNCVLTGNSHAIDGGGIYKGTLHNCALTGNSAGFGGGAYGSTLYNCALSGNSASFGGGAYGSTLYNCIVYYNTAPDGSNFHSCTLNYCCATPDPGGVGNITNEPLLVGVSHLSASSPCIDKGNAAYASGTDIDGEAWSSPPSIGCDEYHAGAVTGSLSVAMAASYTNVNVGFTIDFTALIEGRTTASRWSFGDGIVISNRPYVSHAWSSAGVYPVVLTVWNESVPQGVLATVRVIVVVQPVHYVRADSPAPASPFVTWETAASNIQDAVDAATTMGALVLVTNGVYDTGGRTANGALTNRLAIDKPLIVRSVNGPKVTIIKGAGPKGDAAIRCVYLGTNAALIGFTLANGHTHLGYRMPLADVHGGGVFCEPSAVLSNCVLTGNSAYGDGGGAYDGALYNCALTGNSAIYGGGAEDSRLYNCTLTGNSAGNGGGVFGGTLYNCALTGNLADGGGGAYDGALYNCTLTDNSAGGGGGVSGGTLYNCALTGNSAHDGGGAYGGTLNNCILTGNSAGRYYGGGAYNGTLNNCILTGNWAWWVGGGAYGGTLYNCIVYYNTAPMGSNFYNSTFNYCCTTPDPGGAGNITGDPTFVDRAAGNLRLLSNSPCINAGTNQDWMIGATDLDGNPRIYGGGRVDMGAYEYQGSLSMIPANWLARYGLPIDGSEDHGDADGDGMDNWREWWCNTDPTNEISFLRFTTSASEGTGFVARWQSADGVRYQLKRSTNLSTDGFSYFVRTNIVATPPINSETDTTAVGSGPWFYRVGVE